MDEQGERSKKRLKSMVVGRKKAPNILISGTPGTGKTTLCQKIVEELSGSREVDYLSIGQYAKDNGFVLEYDEQYKCDIIDEDKVLDSLEPKMSDPDSNVTVLIEHLNPDLFPERWFDAVFVCRSSTENLFDRLKSRGYDGVKLQDNVQCEIFGTILEEAQESYRPEFVHELKSDNEDEMEDNVARVLKFVQEWKCV